MSIKNMSNFYIILFLTLLLSAGELAIDMYIPSLPYLKYYFHVPKHMVALSITAFLIGQAVFQWFYGSFSDAYGRKKTLYIGLVLSCAGSIICSFSNWIGTFFIGRIIMGAGCGAGLSMMLAICRDKFEGTYLARTIAFITSIYFIVFGLAPTIGGVFQHYLFWQANFIFLSIYFAAMLILSLFLPETHNPEARHPFKLKLIFHNYLEILKHRIFITNLLCVSIAYSALFAYAAITPFLFQEILHLNPFQYGLLAMFTAAALVASSLINGWLIKKIGLNVTIIVALSILILSSIVSLFLSYLINLNIWSVMIPFGCFIFGVGFLGTCCAVNAMTPFPKIAGSAGSLWGSLQFFCVFLLSLVFAHIHARTSIPFSWCLLAIALLSSFAYSLSFSHKTTNTSDTES